MAAPATLCWCSPNVPSLYSARFKTGPEKFVYTIKCYTEDLMTSKDRVIVGLMYAQAVYYVLNHTWPVTEDEGLALAGRMCVMRFGRHNRRK